MEPQLCIIILLLLIDIALKFNERFVIVARKPVKTASVHIHRRPNAVNQNRFAHTRNGL